MSDYHELLANKVRQRLEQFNDVEEKWLFNGLAFLVNGKLCIGVKQNEVLFRINPEMTEEVAERMGCRQMVNGKTVMKGYFFVETDSLENQQEFNFWIDLAIQFNPLAKAAKRKKV